MNTLADRLKKEREAKGWRKADLQRAAGIKSASTLTDLEKGATESPQLGKIAAALGVNVLWLQYGTGPKTTDHSLTDPQHRTSIKAAAKAIIESRHGIDPLIEALASIEAAEPEEAALLRAQIMAKAARIKRATEGPPPTKKTEQSAA